MGRNYRSCAVPGCLDTHSTRHRFPNPHKDRKRYNIWVEIIQNSTVNILDPLRVYRNYRVCHQHFTISDISSNMYLVKTAVPTQKLPTATGSRASASTALESRPSASTASELTVSESRPSASTASELTVVLPVMDSPPNLSMPLIIRPAQLTPKAKYLYKQIRNLKKMTTVYQLRNATLKSRLQSAKKFFNYEHSSLPEDTIKFCMHQLLRKRVASKGQRFSFREKLMSLALYKTSGAGYQLLSRWFQLLFRRTMSRMLHMIPIESGINPCVISSLKKMSQNLKPTDKLCSLLFDEMSLIPYVEYDESSDKLVGFEETIIFDHVLVFMVKAVRGRCKQAIVYSFCKSTIKSLELKQLIKDIVQTINSQTELKIISLICDQGSTNRVAVESLINESRIHYLQRNVSPKRCVLIGCYEVVPLYDVPHLIKGIRNNLLTKDLIWEQQDSILKATWRDIIAAYEIDDCRDELQEIKMLGKIKPHHINPDQRRKMKVAYATQVLSNSMAVAIFSMAKTNEEHPNGIHKLDENSIGTARVCKFFDTLFDSLNGGRIQSDDISKRLKGPVSRESGHIAFWRVQIQALRNMYFVKEGCPKQIVPPSLKNFILTLQGYILVSKKILKCTAQYAPRNLNQDSLENSFGQIRQHRCRLNYLSPKQFQESYKAVKHVSEKHSLGSNCTETFESSLLQLEELLTTTKNTTEFVANQIYIQELQNSNILEHEVSSDVLINIGNVIKKTLYKYKCQTCIGEIFEVDDSGKSSFKAEFMEVAQKIYNITAYVVNLKKEVQSILKTITILCANHICFNLECHKNLIMDHVIKIIVKIYVRGYCATINSRGIN